MAKGLINAAGGLSAADKETVRQWMVEGHDILRGKVAGSIPRKAAATYTPGTSDQVLEAGQYLQGAQTIAGDANLAAGNIRSGVSIFGVAGSFDPFVGDFGQILLMWWGANAGGSQPSAGSIIYSVFTTSSKAVPKAPINGNGGTITIPGATIPPGKYAVISSGANVNDQYNLLLTDTAGRILTMAQKGLTTSTITVTTTQWIGFCNLTGWEGGGGIIVARNA